MIKNEIQNEGKRELDFQGVSLVQRQLQDGKQFNGVGRSDTPPLSLTRAVTGDDSSDRFECVS